MTYSKEGEDAEEQPLRDKLMSSVDSEVLAYDNYQSYNDAVFGLNPEPPRALPSSEGQETRVLYIGLTLILQIDRLFHIFHLLCNQKLLQSKFILRLQLEPRHYTHLLFLEMAV